jgi:Skp family chaperone for outer membrane proteins
MYRNISDDLEAGYNPDGECITKQRRDIESFLQKFNEEMDKIKEKTKQQVEHWCYYVLKKRGAIA